MNFFNIGPFELLLILVVILVVFGPDKVSELGGTLGKSLRQLRQASKELTQDLDLEELSPSVVLDILAASGDDDEEVKEIAEDGDGKTPALPAAIADPKHVEPELFESAAAEGPASTDDPEAALTEEMAAAEAAALATEEADAGRTPATVPAGGQNGDGLAPELSATLSLPALVESTSNAPAGRDAPLVDYESPEDEDSR